MGGFSLSHLLILAIILLVFFGPSRLPDLGKSIGKALRGFKEGMSEIETTARELPAKEDRTEATREKTKSGDGTGQG